MADAPRTARALARETLTREIRSAARARLAAVYAFRPAPRDVPGALLTDLDRPLPFEPALLTLEDR
ncbi:hypothetical protein [Isoptericola sp. QY 916]|uniref:hypothetical protein n=1 Tax=Isoptericola sp. QY 916 TaxID=2782570 RepID=UPI003D2FFC69|nr:hypothetical protein [Isoptericola sp. QY 916]